MDDTKKLLKLVPKWAEKIGHIEAQKRLILADVPPRTAYRIVTGDHGSTVRALLAKVLETEMAKDGITLAG